MDFNGGGNVHLLIESKKAELKSCVTGSVCYGNIMLPVQKGGKHTRDAAMATRP